MPKKKTQLEMRKCVICGKEFMPKIRTNVCCSEECKKEREKQKSKEWYRVNVKEKKPEKGICVVCGKKFAQKKVTQKCCSDECRHTLTIQRQNAYFKEKYAREKAERKEKQKQIPKTNHEKIADIAIAARKEGLTYGQYVAKYMGKF